LRSFLYTPELDGSCRVRQAVSCVVGAIRYDGWAAGRETPLPAVNGWISKRNCKHPSHRDLTHLFFKRTAACKQTMVPLMGKFGTTNEGLYSLSKGIKVRSARRSRIETNASNGIFAQESRRETRCAQHARLFP
jgi:hypothetical protein